MASAHNNGEDAVVRRTAAYRRHPQTLKLATLESGKLDIQGRESGGRPGLDGSGVVMKLRGTRIRKRGAAAADHRRDRG